MRKTVKWNSLALACLLSLSVLGSCGGSGEDQTENKPTREEIVLQTVHGGKADVTDSFIVQNGQTDYALVIAENATTQEVKAAGIVQKYFEEATGKLLSVKTDSTCEYSETAKYISVGDTSLKTAAGVTYDYAKTSSSGFEIETKGNSVFLVGGWDGVVFGAYELLEYWFDFDYFGEYCYQINKNVKNLPLHDFAVTEIPDIETRTPYAMGTVRYNYDPSLRDAMRLNKEDITMGYVSTLHNSFYYLPPEDHAEEHRDWYSDVVDPYTMVGYAQLCYPTIAKSEEAINICFEKVKQVVVAEPTKSIVMFVQQDNTAWCTCDTCKQLNQTYGCDSAGYIWFLNALAEKTNAWAMKELGRDIKICGMAYHKLEPAPTKYNESTGKYEPIDDSVKLSPHLYIEYAPHNCDYQVAFDGKGNEKDIATLKSWSALSEKLLMYTYNQAAYNDYLMFYDNFNSMQRNYQLMVQCKTTYILDLGQYNCENSSGFNALRLYLSSKLAWDCQADYQALIDKFFKGYFGAAAQPMRELFDSLRHRYTYLHEIGTLTKTFRQYASDIVYPEGYLDSLLRLIDDAYAAIEGLKASDFKTYEGIKERICLESVYLRCLRIKLYANSYTEDQVLEMKKSVKSDCIRLRITKHKEAANIAELWKEWGV